MVSCRSKSTKHSLKSLKKAGFRDPIQIVVDASFCLRMKKIENSYVKIIKIFGEPPKLLIPSCEFRKGKKTEFSNNCDIMKCKHEEANCLDWILRGKNRHHYIIATCDAEKLNRIKILKNVPFLKTTGHNIILDASNIKDCKEVKKTASEKEIERLEEIFKE